MMRQMDERGGMEELCTEGLRPPVNTVVVIKKSSRVNSHNGPKCILRWKIEKKEFYIKFV